MANPVAAQTFDFVRVYLYTRTGGAPGSGSWVTTAKIFDGNLTPNTVPVCSTFSAGGLDFSDPTGIVGTSGNGGDPLAFIGNGYPAVPYIITYPGQAGSSVSADYWEVSQGAFYSGGAYFLPHFTGGAGGGILRVIRSATGLDGSWAECDAANAPTLGDGLLLASQRVDNMLYFFISLDGSDTNWSILPFDMSANGGLGAYGAPFAPLTLTVNSFGSIPDGDSWGNSLFQFPDGGFVIVYNVSGGVFAKIWNKISWSDPISLLGVSIGNIVVDPSFSGLHIMNYDTKVDDGTPVDYNFLSYPSGAVTSIASAIPAPVSDQDGIGHSSIQNGMLFVPRDDGNDFFNSVWVTLISAISFAQEALPIPPGETNEIVSDSINTQGQNYANGDTGTVDGGLPGYSASYRVEVNDGLIGGTAINNPGTGYAPGDAIQIQGTFTDQASGTVTTIGALGAVTGISLTILGVGYSISSNVDTTTFGLGFGLTIDITSIINGAVRAFIIDDQGGGYSVASAVGTTPGGTQPGAGTELTIDILSVGGKSPSCSYMMFPNGYSLTASPLSLACPIATITPVGTPYSSMLLASGGTPPYTFEILS